MTLADRYRLTAFQTQEVEHGMSVDSDDGEPAWGVLHWRKRGLADLEVTDVDAALWRITSARDIVRDNENAAGTRSLDTLIEKIVADVGVDTLKPETRRWLA